jgi:type III pantothenate kinase
MLLAVDIGNSNTVIGVWSGDRLTAHWRVATDRRRMPDEYAVLLHSLFGLAGTLQQAVTGVIICSVVPDVQEAFRSAIRSTWDLEPLIVSPDLDAGLEVKYSPPEAVGADRIANAVAGRQLYGAPTIVVDFGTATTVDAVSADGAYVGGSIAPGLQISIDALYARTARLKPVPLAAPTSAIGGDTAESLQSGIVFGYAGLVDGLVGRFQAVLGTDAAVIGTGGLAPVVVPHSRTVQHVDLDLTLVGLRLLYERNVRASDSRTRQDQSFA